jgi:hypothetical protein
MVICVSSRKVFSDLYYALSAMSVPSQKAMAQNSFPFLASTPCVLDCAVWLFHAMLPSRGTQGREGEGEKL